MIMDNKMKNIRVEKITLNVGAGTDKNVLDRGALLLKAITGIEAVKTVAKKRIPGWNLRPGLPIGCKVTLRGKQAVDVLKRVLVAKDNKVPSSKFDKNGNFAFGLKEYIDIPGVKYDPAIGMMGFEVSVTLYRPGFRVKNRRLLKAKIGKNHLIKKEDAVAFAKSFGIEVVEE